MAFQSIKKNIRKLFKTIIGGWNYFLYIQRMREHTLTKLHYQHNDNVTNEEQLFIYIANGLTWHGGLCDRFKGLVYLYKWCKKNKKEFRIAFTHPFELSKYLEPNEYDWRIADNEVCYNKETTQVKCFMCDPDIEPYRINGSIYEKQDWWLDTLKDLRKKQVHVYTNIMPKDNEEFGRLFKELFKPSAQIQERLEYHKQQIGNNYISISFRFTTLLGDFTDCTGTPLPDLERELLIKRSLEIVEEIHKSSPKHDKVLVTADSSTFLKAVKQIQYVYVIEGKVGHIDYDNSDEINIKTFVDFLMIVGAQKVYLGKGPGMFQSDFARRASMINNREFETFYYEY